MDRSSSASSATIYDLPLSRYRRDINLSTFAFLFSEIVQYSHNRVESIPELEAKLSAIGQRVGARILELVVLRERHNRREIRLSAMLLFVNTVVWKHLFGRQADALEKDGDSEATYYIVDRDMPVNKYISVPKEMGSLNCAAFVAGIVEAIMEGSGFPCAVSAHTVEGKGTTLIVKCDTTGLPPEALA